MKLNPRKCKFAAKEVKYLGHVLSKDGIAVDTSKTDAVRTFPRPRNATEVRAFLGLANYYRRFVNGFADVAAPLNRLVSKNVKFQWDDACDDAFQELKKRLTSPPILAFPDFNKQFILYTDASGFAISYILGQKDEKGTGSSSGIRWTSITGVGEKLEYHGQGMLSVSGGNKALSRVPGQQKVPSLYRPQCPDFCEKVKGSGDARSTRKMGNSAPGLLNGYQP